MIVYEDILARIKMAVRHYETRMLAEWLDKLVQECPECTNRTDAVLYVINCPTSGIDVYDLAEVYHSVDSSAEEVIQTAISRRNEMRSYDFVGRQPFRPDGDWGLFTQLKPNLEKLKDTLEYSPNDVVHAKYYIDKMRDEAGVSGDAVQLLLHITQGELKDRLVVLSNKLKPATENKVERLAQEIIDKFPPSFAEQYRDEDKIVWALQLALQHL